MRLSTPSIRRRFLDEPEVLFKEYKLTAEECDLVRRRDWRAMIHYGVIFFMLEKLGALVAVSNLHIYAAMRGQPLEEFLKTRNAPGVLLRGGRSAGEVLRNGSGRPCREGCSSEQVERGRASLRCTLESQPSKPVEEGSLFP